VALKSTFGRRTEHEAPSAPDRNDNGVDDRVEGPTAASTGATAVDRDRDGVDDRTEAPKTVETTKVKAGHTSLFATLSLVVGVCAVLASLSGRLAPVGLALGVLGLLLAAVGTAATGRPTVTGKGVAMLGLLASLAGVLFAIFAMNHTASWLDSDVDQVGKLRDWLDTQLPWLQSW
jgi:hypothetical protein